MGDIFLVQWGKQVEKQLAKIPTHIVRKFFAWVSSVKLAGLHKVRLSPGFHDEPLARDRKGQRSVRLNKGYRAIYVERDDGSVEFIEVTGVTHHEY